MASRTADRTAGLPMPRRASGAAARARLPAAGPPALADSSGRDLTPVTHAGFTDVSREVHDPGSSHRVGQPDPASEPGLYEGDCASV